MHILPPCVHLYSDIFQEEILHLDDMDEINAGKKNEKEKSRETGENDPAVRKRARATARENASCM